MISLRFSGKGQSALEFIILISFSLIIVSSLVVVFQNNISDMEKVREAQLVDQVYNLALSEIDFALMSRPVYERTFYLPSTLGGYTYEINIYHDVEVVISYLGVDHVRFLSEVTSIDGNFTVPGPNYLIKYCDDDDCFIELNKN
jgi:hypothetical protein